MKNVITIDTETYYADDFSLSKMTTEAYVRDPRFEVIGMGIMIGDGDPKWVHPSLIQAVLDTIDWSKHAVLCHNTAFDGLILSQHYGVVPSFYLDTWSMAQPVHSQYMSCSLAKLSAHFNLGEKGTEVVAAKGKHLSEFTNTEYKAYGEYCKNDCDLTWKLFYRLLPSIPTRELAIIDRTIRMFCDPRLVLNADKLQHYLGEVQAKQAEMLATVEQLAPKDVLMSNPQFALLLESLGVDVPMKPSPRNPKKLTYAFGKNDKGLKALLEGEDELISALVAARIGVKSTIEETRTKRLLDISQRGYFPIPLTYCGAWITSRWSGWDKVNPQNFRRGGAIRAAVEAPEGYVIASVDSSNIELRVNHMISGQLDTVAALREGRDLYCEFATMLYGRPITKADVLERFIGKTCVAKGTPVLCERGWIPIERVLLTDKVWDGENWVCHKGVAFNGIKETLNLCGAQLTPDHSVWSGTRWLQAQYLQQEKNTLCRALDFAAGNLPSQDMFWGGYAAFLRFLLLATAEIPNMLWTTTTLRSSAALDAVYVGNVRVLESDIGNISAPCQTTPIELDYLIGSLQQLLAVVLKTTRRTTITAEEELTYVRLGVQIEPRFLTTFKHSLAGITQCLKWIVLMLIEGMRRATFGSLPGILTCSTKEKSATLRLRLPVYDLLSTGPKNRFTILTGAGPLLVHNCHLSLGYGCGPDKFREMCRIKGILLDEQEAKRIVTLWRDAYIEVTRFWRRCENLIPDIAAGSEGLVDANGLVQYAANKLITPPCNAILYPDLARAEDSNWYYTARYGAKKHIYGPKMVENICQHLARNIVAEQLLIISQRYPVVLTVHDSVEYLVPENEADEAVAFGVDVMSTSPTWWSDIPLAAEGAASTSL